MQIHEINTRRMEPLVRETVFNIHAAVLASPGNGRQSLGDGMFSELVNLVGPNGIPIGGSVLFERKRLQHMTVTEGADALSYVPKFPLWTPQILRERTPEEGVRIRRGNEIPQESLEKMMRISVDLRNVALRNNVALGNKATSIEF